MRDSSNESMSKFFRHSGRPLKAIFVCLLAALAGGASARPALVALDVGHTLAAPGATSARGDSEFGFNLALAKDLSQALMARGLGVRMINQDGLVADLRERPLQAAGADLLVSIHHDSVGEDELQRWRFAGRELDYSDAWAGHSLFVSRLGPDLPRSLLCARAIGARLQRLGFVPTAKNGRRRAWADRQLAVHYYDRLVVLYRTTVPALLIEAGVIKNRDEEVLLRDPGRRRRMADGIATGIAACLSVEPLRGR